jgi:hypothetical protein
MALQPIRRLTGLPGPGGIGAEKAPGSRSTSGATESPLTALTKRAERE